MKDKIERKFFSLFLLTFVVCRSLRQDPRRISELDDQIPLKTFFYGSVIGVMGAIVFSSLGYYQAAIGSLLATAISGLIALILNDAFNAYFSRKRTISH